jgi:hypothetical protein
VEDTLPYTGPVFGGAARATVEAGLHG